MGREQRQLTQITKPPRVDWDQNWTMYPAVYAVFLEAVDEFGFSQTSGFESNICSL